MVAHAFRRFGTLTVAPSPVLSSAEVKSYTEDAAEEAARVQGKEEGHRSSNDGCVMHGDSLRRGRERCDGCEGQWCLGAAGVC